MRHLLTVTLYGGLSLVGNLWPAQETRVPDAEVAVPAPVDEPMPPSATARAVGRPAIGWNVPQRYWTNTRRSLGPDGLRGHVTVIDFIRTGCSHCQKAAPSREALYRRYRGRGLQMIAFQSPGTSDAEEQDWGAVKRVIREWRITYPVAFDENRMLFGKYGFQYFPTVMVIDRRGIVRYCESGFTPETERELEQFVAAMTAAGVKP